MVFTANFPILKLVSVLTLFLFGGCDFVIVEEENADNTYSCSIALDQPCSDTIIAGDSTCDTLSISWDPDNRMLKKRCLSGSGSSSRELFGEQYDEDMLRDTLFWYSLYQGDTTASGFATYTYHSNKVIQTEELFDLYTYGDPPWDTVFYLSNSYDVEGRKTRETRVDYGNYQVSYYDIKGNVIQRDYYQSDDGEQNPETTTQNFYYYNEENILTARTRYFAEVIRDSVVFGPNKVRLLERDFHPNGILNIETIFHYEEGDSLMIKTGQTIVEYDENGIHVKSIQRDGDFNIIQIKNGSDTEWTPCTEPYNYLTCNTP
jgi:hypothetical protein